MKFRLKQIASAILTGCILFTIAACGGKHPSHAPAPEGRRVEMRHAQLLRIIEADDATTLVEIVNPWDTTKFLGKYALIERGKETPTSIPDVYMRINVPLERSVVYSGLHSSVIAELGGIGQVNGVCDVAYISDSLTSERVSNGKIIDCGSNYSPNLEKILSLKPDAVILSPYENSQDLDKFRRIGLTPVEAADYMEATPLARAEWIRLFGRLYGNKEGADSIFNQVEKDYNSLKRLASSSAERPKVLIDRIYSGVWDVPTSGSVTGIMIEDAGGRNPFNSYKDGGAAHLAPEEVLMKAGEADIWLVRYAEPKLSIDDLRKENALYARIRALTNGRVYGANTIGSGLFEDATFHPEKVLREMIILFHPESVNGPLKYYHKLQ
ncbi:MAG: ABC transporter substrate-binding protein [Muribaculaceae bacterium]|nr:ABC transporter substrate-binding protein [Muribaculaceae bacterium]